MRVLHAAETIKGGIATYLRDLLPLQARDFGGDSVIVVIPASQRGELPDAGAVRIVCFDDSCSRAKAALRLALLCRKLVHAERIDILHLHSTFAGAVTRPLLAAAGGDVQLVYCPHGWAWDRQVSGLQAWLIKGFERLQACWTDAIVCISAHERTAACDAGISRGKLHLVVNGASLHSAAPVRVPFHWKEEHLRVVFMGRLDRQKGFDVLLEALALMPPVVHVAVVGAAVLGDTKLTLPASVDSLGWLNAGQLAHVLADADVVVVPSRWEGFGLVAIEAMRAGVPVVASAVGGLKEVVVDGETGYLVPPGAPAELAKVLKSTPLEQWHAMGKAGRLRFVAYFNIERVAAELATMYKKLLFRG